MNSKSMTAEDTTLANLCFKAIQDKIIRGIFAPGQKLKVSFLKEELNAGQSPIREALSRLTEQGLVEAQGNKGFRVMHISEADILDSYTTFFEIEMLALQKALIHGNDAWESAIVAALHQLSRIETKRAVIPYNEWAQRNDAFHTALISGCNSPLLLEVRAMIFRRFDRYCRIAFYAAQEELHLNHKEHRIIANAALTRNFEALKTAMHHHIFGAQKEVITILKNHNLL